MSAPLGEILKRLRNSTGMTQQTLADKLNLKNKSTLASWEGGKSEPNIINFLQFCMYCDIPEAYALAKKIGLDQTAVWDFTNFEDEYFCDKSEFSYCPYCGKELPKSKNE